MILGSIFLLASAVCGMLFWVWVVKGILARVYKDPFGKGNVIKLILFGLLGWVFLFAAICTMAYSANKKGLSNIPEKTAEFAAVTKESFKKGWNKGLLKKLDNLDFSIEKIQEVEDEMNMTNSGFRTYEATLIVKNPAEDSTLTYRELSNANIVYAEDENEVLIPAFLINHSNLDEIPWIMRAFVPAYRHDQRVTSIPEGSSYLYIRFDMEDNHKVQKIGIGERTIDVSNFQILPLKKDNGVSKGFEEK